MCDIPLLAGRFLQSREYFVLGRRERCHVHNPVGGLFCFVEGFSNCQTNGRDVGGREFAVAVIENSGLVVCDVESEKARLQAPVKEWSRDHACPRQSFGFLLLQVLCDLQFRCEEVERLGHLGVVKIASKVGWEEAFYTCFDGGIDDGFLLWDMLSGHHANYRILALESLDELAFRVVVIDRMNFEVGWKGGFRGLASDNRHGEERVASQGIYNARAKITTCTEYNDILERVGHF